MEHAELHQLETMVRKNQQSLERLKAMLDTIQAEGSERIQDRKQSNSGDKSAEGR